ncbi:MAG: hypothetical protein OIF40_16535 [Mangrovicoccus sp.]|nr:hypothetical protein [Mangrovicoccus sp.]
MLDSLEEFEDDFEDAEMFFNEDFEESFEEEEEDLFSPEDIETMEAIAEDFAEGYEDFEDEDAFLGALAGLAAKALPMAVKAAPMLLSAGRSILSGLSRSKPVRTAARAVPHIMRRTAADQLRRYSRGQAVTRRSTMRSAARHTANALHPAAQRRIIIRHRNYIKRRSKSHYPNSRQRRYQPRLRRVCRCRMVRY